MAQGNLYGNLIQCTGGTENADGSTDWSTSTCAVVAQPTNASTCYGFYEFYYGSVYQGDVGVYDTDQLVYTMSNVSYAVMEQQQNMTCVSDKPGTKYRTSLPLTYRCFSMREAYLTIIWYLYFNTLFIRRL